MKAPQRKARRARRAARHNSDVKDRLIQTRVPERLESVLKEEAKKRRLTVSHLIRNVLEDTLDLVDTVVIGAGDLVGASVEIAEQVARDAGKIATTARQAVRARTGDSESNAVPASATPGTSTAPVANANRAAPAPAIPAIPAVPEPEATTAVVENGDLDHVLAWNAVVVNRPAACASCKAGLARGNPAHLGISSDPTHPPTWLCDACLGKL
ncbi:MAG TPA: hypothetical protein VH142_01990 [Polyangiaceae bacterium]|nr:hypothetical protein [Polyangiaceae bacterium]